MTPSPRDIASVKTLPQLLAYRVASTPEGEAYRAFNPATHAWESWSWQHTGLQVQRWSAAIGAMQLPQAARIAILLPNGLNALCADQSTLATGCVPVPLHAIDNPGSIAYILADCEASMLIVGQRAQWEKICAVGTPFPALRAVVFTDEDTSASLADKAGTPPPQDGPRVGSLAQWLEGADQAPSRA
eukprot:gene18681-18551_t